MFRVKSFLTNVKNHIHSRINQPVINSKVNYLNISAFRTRNQDLETRILWGSLLIFGAYATQENYLLNEFDLNENNKIDYNVKSNTISSRGSRKRDSRRNSSVYKRRDTSGSVNFIISSFCTRGDRPYMEDTYYISPNKRFLGVYDGHGGADVAKYLRKRLYPTIYAKINANNSDLSVSNVENIVKNSIAEVNDEIMNRIEWQTQGSTAVSVLMSNNDIWSINVGDSRAILCRNGKSIPLTLDHKPNCTKEKQRIEKLGGKVEWHGYVDINGEPIEEMGAYRINGNLAVARSLGDKDQQPYISSDPDIFHFERDFEKDEYIVLASDGLWDTFTNDEVIQFVSDVLNGQVGGRASWHSGSSNETNVPLSEWRTRYSADRDMIKAAKSRRKRFMAEYLVQEALERGSTDNITVLVVWLKN